MARNRGKANIFLGGFMASGKTSVGRELARVTGRPFLDVDAIIEQRAGMTAAAIFASEGETEFRRIEAQVLKEICELENCIVALGGGVLVNDENRRIVKDSGPLVILDVKPETVRFRVAAQPGQRPLLEMEDLEQLMRGRRKAYDCGSFRLETDALPVDRVVLEIQKKFNLSSFQKDGREQVFCGGGLGNTVIVGRGILERLPELLGRDVNPFVVADALTAHLFGDRIGKSKGLAILPRGEAAKSLEQVGDLYRAFSGGGVDRSDTVVALGGGAVGDTAGFAAATWMRGVELVQCPTTLLAQVDSAIGGKVGVNLPQGKNLVGAFYQPRLVLSDVNCLASLSWQDYRQGLSEVVKYGLGEDHSFFEWLEKNASALEERNPDVLAETTAWCARLKLEVVAGDEKERTGARARLNLGHTVGHALEAASQYRTWRHGDGVAVGMLVATHLACKTGDCDVETLDRLRTLLFRLGLPQAPDRPWEEILPHLARDKKFESGKVRLVLPRTGEKSRVRDDISLDQLHAAYEEVIKWKRD
ncbi:MAG: 3-dehydroquinate synthase [Thermovirgaceae bacterium]|nr:3-dehydroquinate synthase [Thermovirgaceae bacterium]